MPPTLEQELYDLGLWVSRKFQLHVTSHRHNSKQVLQGEVWQCDLGCNVGQEKNKERPVLIVSNNAVNRSGKAVVICITDADKKMNQHDKPQQNTWVLLYSSTTDPTKMFRPGRTVPRTAPTYAFLSKDSVAQCEEIRAVSKSRLVRRLGCLDVADMNIVKQKLKNTFSIT